YSNSEYSSPELLIYELENSNEENFSNEEIELTEEEAKQLIYENIFLEKIKYFESLIPQFVSKNMDIAINPEINEEQKIHIFVTYNEYTFYANDSYPSIWAPLTCGYFIITSTEISELNLLLTFLQEA
ncbi:5811_t:CDS:2, partial [Scutellospora calospora]